MNRLRRQHAGFTLVELLVAITVTVVLAGLLIAVTSGALNIWQRAQSRLTMNSQVGVALDLLTRDLQAAVHSPAAETSFAVDILSSSQLGPHNWRLEDPRIKPDDTTSLHALANTTILSEQRIADSRFGQSGVWLRFITTNVATGGSLPTAVSYQINRRPVSGAVTGPNQAPARYSLFRSKVNSDDTFKNGYDLTAAAYASLSDAPLGDALCDNVVDFGVWCHVREGNGTLTRLYPDADNDRSFHGSAQVGVPSASRYPMVIDVLLRVLNDSGATKLDQIELGRVERPPAYANDSDWWWGVVDAESRTYTVRVEVMGASLP
ncbi:MAG: type II secretion system GspH family protein [Cephaloticoccus sp.]|nr:type II secretion system GspH family protein [Cephaloticoccus sp.]MCF7761456.1 type II secretion system GspH family protein [Cephaloticoccus sp.]